MRGRPRRRRRSAPRRVDENDFGALAQGAQDAPERRRGDELARVGRDRARRQHLELTQQLAGHVAVPVAASTQLQAGARARAGR